MFISNTKPCENFHHVVDFLLFFCSSFIQSSLLFQIEKFPADDEFFSSDPLGEFLIVDIDESVFHFFLLLAIIVVKLHFCKEELGVIIVFHLEVSSLWHIPYDLRGV